MNFNFPSLDLSFVIGLLFSVCATQILGMWITFIVMNVFVFSYSYAFNQNVDRMLCRGMFFGRNFVS